MVTKVSTHVEELIATTGRMPEIPEFREHEGFVVEWYGPGYYGLIRRAGESELHWSPVTLEIAQDWVNNEWDSCNNRSAREGWREAGFLEMAWLGDI